MLLRCFLAAGAACVALSGAASALPVSAVGTFQTDDEVALIDFTLASGTTVRITSYGYGGGVMNDGTVIAPGGFDTMLWLFDSDGFGIRMADDGGANVNPDPVNGQSWDAFLEIALAAGDYTLAVSQYNNTPRSNDIGDGFGREGDIAFTQEFGCTSGFFCDDWQDEGGVYLNRTGDWAVDIVDAFAPRVSEVPLPAGAPLLLAGLAALGVAGLRRRR